MASPIIRASIIGDATKFKSALAEAEGASKGWGDKMGNVGKAWTVGVTTPIIAGFSMITEAAAGEKQEMALLAEVIKNNIPNATQSMIDANEDWISALSYGIGVADGDIRGLQQKFVAAGASIEEAQRLTAMSYDTAAATGKDANSVADAFVKATMGQVSGLSRLGIEVRNADGSMKSFDQIQQDLARHTGTATAMMDNEAGQAEINKLKFADLKETLGMHLLPIKAKLVEILGRVLDAFGSLSPEMQQTILGVVAVVAAIGPVLIMGGKLVTAFGQVGKAFSALSKLVSMNPWVLLIAATIALVTLIVTNWDTIVEALKKAWDWIKKTVESVWNGIKDFFKGVLDFIVNLFKNWSLPGLIMKHWDKIKEGVSGVIQWIKDVWNGVVEWFRGLPQRITNAVSGLFDGLKNAFKNAINWIIDKWNNFKIEIKLPTILGGGTIRIDTPNIPKFHMGGVFDAPVPGGEGLAILKDKEKILRPGETLPASAPQVTFNVTVNAGIGTDPSDIVEALENLRRRWETWNGPALGNARLA